MWINFGNNQTCCVCVHAEAGVLSPQSDQQALGRPGRDGDRGRDLPCSPGLPPRSRRLCEEERHHSDEGGGEALTRGTAHTHTHTHTHFIGTTNDSKQSNLHVLVCFQLSQVIVNCGGLSAVIDSLGDCQGSLRLPGIMMLGYVATHSENLAMAVILCKVCARSPSPNPEAFPQVLQHLGYI